MGETNGDGKNIGFGLRDTRIVRRRKYGETRYAVERHFPEQLVVGLYVLERFVFRGRDVRFGATLVKRF